MREVRVEQVVIGHAIVDGINTYVREVLVQRCPELGTLWDGPDDGELDRLKYDVAATCAAKWAVSQVGDDVPAGPNPAPQADPAAADAETTRNLPPRPGR